MINLLVNKNLVVLDKSQEGCHDFVSKYLVKYEDVKKVDPFSSTKKVKRYRTVKERRDLYIEDSNFIYFSRGVLSVIPDNPSEFVISFCQEDQIVCPEINKDRIKNSMKAFQLRDDQVIATVKCLVCRRGVIQLPTAVGKSAIITSTIKELLSENPDMKSLVLAPTLSTVTNIYDTLQSEGVSSSIFGHPSKEITNSVTVSLVQSLISYSKNDPSFLEGISAVFYDECLPRNSKILLPNGSYATIGQIYEDDSIQEVMSFNTVEGKYEVRKILRKFKTPYNDRFWKVYYKDPITLKSCGVSLTPNHKVYTKDRGYVQAKDLTIDDFIKVDFPFARHVDHLLKSTFIRVLRVSPNVGSKSEYKYNIEVEGNHNYFASNVLVSNCHHLKCDTWNSLNMLIPNVEYSLGFSALSIDKKEIGLRDIRQMSYETSLIVGSSGPVIMHMDPSYYIEKGIIAVPIVFRVETFIKVPEEYETSWTYLVKNGIMSTSRSIKISQVVSIFSRYGRKSLVLVSERSHAFTISKFLVSLGITDFGISFGAGKGFICKGSDPSGEVVYEEVDTLSVIDRLSSGEISTVIGTSHIDEGVDMNKLDCVVLACGGKKDRRIIQRVGRALRKSKTGKYAYVVDFTDSGSRVLSRQSRSRLNLYKESLGIPSDKIYSGLTIEEVESNFLSLEGLI